MKICIGVLFVLLFSQSAFAATRTIQFSGIAAAGAGGLALQDVSLQHSATAECQVAVINTGAAPQRVDSLQYWFTEVPAANTYRRLARTHADADQCRVTSGTLACGNCVGVELAQGDFCIMSYMTSVLSNGVHRTGICAGTIVVSDAQPSSPGSVVASGTVSVNQEALVLGGVLSGAYYASGTHVRGATSGSDTKNTDLAATVAGVSTAAVDTVNMNIFCETACTASGEGKWCDEQCGKGHGSLTGKANLVLQNPAWNETPTNSRASHISLFENPRSLRLITAASGDISGGGGTIFWDPNGGATKLYSTESAWGNVFNWAVTTPDEWYLRPMITTANPHWAGGMVYELEIGPLGAICSANSNYASMGGVPFTHGDNLTGDAVSKEPLFPARVGPPEALFCAHRHGNSDLYMRVGSSSPFPINGGAPF